MATINNIKKRADDIKNAYEPESVTAEDVGGLIGDLAEVTEQANGVLEGVVEDVDYGQRRTDALQETLNSIGAEGGTVQSAGSVALAAGTGLVATDVQQGIRELATEIFPVKATFYESNAGTFEVGDKIIPRMVLDIRRNGVNVQSTSTVTVSPEVTDEITVINNRKVITDDELTSGSKIYTINVRQGGQDAAPLTASYTFLNYRYYGAVSTKPANAAAVKTLCQNGTLTKQLSSSTTMGKTALAASKYFVFVIPTTSPNLIVKNANSGGTVDNAGSGTFEMARVNGTADLNYKYVIVPASSNAWNFEITN